MSGDAILPTHDGLGTFPTSSGLQEHLWQFERRMPHRRKHARRRSSVQKKVDAVEEEQEIDLEDERVARIEKWRLEESKAVLEEIEKETRRRRRRMSRISGISQAIESQETTKENSSAPELSRQDSGLPDQHSSLRDQESAPAESFWQRITRRVIQDLIGLDEDTMSVIFGESLPSDSTPTPTQASPATKAAKAEAIIATQDSGYSWEVKLLERIARELGIIVHQLSENDESLDINGQVQAESDYMTILTKQGEQAQRTRRPQQQSRRKSKDQSSGDPVFLPTLTKPPSSISDAPDTSLWGIEEEPSQSSHLKVSAQLRHEREYWEQRPDIKMIFSCLKRHFSTTQSPDPPLATNGPLPASWTTANSAPTASLESQRRAENIRRQHPLVSRAAERAAAQSRRRDSLLRRHHLQTLTHKRAGSSSCASQSTKRSRRSRSGSSKHFWDIGGSVGSHGSGPAMSAALGGWGEV